MGTTSKKDGDKMATSLYNEIMTSIRQSLNFDAIQNTTRRPFNRDVQGAAASGLPNNEFGEILRRFINNNHTDDATRTSINNAIVMASQRYNIDPNLIQAVIQHESGFRVDAVSHAGAMGLMQLMPGTADSLGVVSPFDINENILGGTRYLRRMLDRFDGDLSLALAAYNAGAGAVERHGGIPPFRETQNYVPRVLNSFAELSANNR